MSKPKTAAEWRDYADTATEAELIESGDAFYCPYCGKLNIYSPYLVDRFSEAGMATGSAYETCCGVCHVSYAPIKSPINAEVYSHVDYSEQSDIDD